MDKSYRDQVLDTFKLTPDQRRAAEDRGHDVVVTAGAGSGKTSTLVARYASLLADGIDLRRVMAVTFTEKAAREMRSRVRKTMVDLMAKAHDEEERKFWMELNAKMDSARISTIHSLCAEILRSHPAEAIVDPRFEVYDESLTAALRAQIVEDTLAKLVGLVDFTPLFRNFEINDLRSLFTYLLNMRLEAQEALEKDIDPVATVQENFLTLLQLSEIQDPLRALRELHGIELMNDAGEGLTAQIEELLAMWNEAEAALASGELIPGLRIFFRMRREKMDLRKGKKDSEAKEQLRQLRTAFDEWIVPICGGKDSGNEPPNQETEQVFAEVLNLIKSAFTILVTDYKSALNQVSSLDFDDLEQGAAQLLQNLAIQEKWQSQVDALLVDEFQDTNQRQRAIVEALSGNSGKLFIVGDAKQSIYRFRRADVSVFRAIRQSIRRRGGIPVDLNLTFRAHAPLLSGMNDILRKIMGEKENPSRPFFEPFSPLLPHHDEPREGITGPHIEYVIGASEDTDTSRAAAASELVARLLQLNKQGQIKQWDDVTLLFRAATGFPPYEAAFEKAGIPFVTVAGKGFYNRAEIRDLLNILRALSDPSDDLAMAGLLRSPAFALSDAALFQLRWVDGQVVDYWNALHGDLIVLSVIDKEKARRAVSILEVLLPLVDRIPVAELLRKLVDATDYRALLAIDDQTGGGSRLWRNLDKLMSDAQASGKVNVRDFLDYLVTINDAGAREGEAPAEALGSVRLMTIHKSKGLQFPIVILADAGRGSRITSEAAYILPEMGLACKLDPEPLLYRLSKVMDKMQVEAEEQRILYVALTRAEQKLIINGHAKYADKAGWTAPGWLRDLTDAINLDMNGLIANAGNEVIIQTTSGQPIRCWASIAESEIFEVPMVSPAKPLLETEALPIYAPLIVKESVDPGEPPEEFRNWRATGKLTVIPPNVVGKMVHKVIELWLFPGDSRLLPLLETSALDAGLADKVLREAAANEALELLGRLATHPLRAEIDSAQEVYHELPYTRLVGDHTETGYIDLVYRSGDSWQIVDFKTDYIENTKRLDVLIEEYAPQLRRYQQVVEELLGINAEARICFLDDHERLSITKIM